MDRQILLVSGRHLVSTWVVPLLSVVVRVWLATSPAPTVIPSVDVRSVVP